MKDLVVGGLCLAVAACASPTATPSNAGGPVPTPAITTSPPSIVPPSPSPSVAVSPSAASTTVTVPLGGTHAVVVTINDASGLLVGARPMVLAPGTIPASYGDRDIAAWTRSGKPDAEVWLYWGGVICDTTSQLVIGAGVTAMTLTEGPRPACDASNVGRGLVLTFAHPIDATTIVATNVAAQPSH